MHHKRPRVLQASVDPAKTDLENAQVAPVVTVNLTAQPTLDHPCPACHQPVVDQHHRQRQPRQSREVPQM